MSTTVVNTHRYTATAVVPVLEKQQRSFTWLGGRLGISREYARRIANGAVSASATHAHAVADALNVPMDLIFSPLKEDTHESV